MRTIALWLLIHSGIAWAGEIANCNHIASALAERQPLHELMLGKDGFLLTRAFRAMLDKFDKQSRESVATLQSAVNFMLEPSHHMQMRERIDALAREIAR